jgi:hypothetical protein
MTVPDLNAGACVDLPLAEINSMRLTGYVVLVALKYFAMILK